MRGVDGHGLLVRLGRLLGPRAFSLAARTIAAGYFLFSPRVAASRRLYARLFPAQSRLYHLLCSFRQYQNFTTIHTDRLCANLGRPVAYSCDGEHRLHQALDRGGVILLMSHLGNWEMAARLLMEARPGQQLLLYMGIKEKEGVERTQKEELRRAGVRIIGIEEGLADPLSAVEGIRMLERGGVVSLTGDRLWRPDQRSLKVRFLGRPAEIPAAPFVFALVSGAPIFVFFAFRTPGPFYRLSFSEPILVRASCRRDRQAALEAAAQQYADLLEAALRSHPLQWYHFGEGPGAAHHRHL